MKTFKKMMALMIAMVMVLATATVAFATNAGSITVKPSTVNGNNGVALTNKTFDAYRILDATYSGQGDDQAVSYKIPARMIGFFDSYFSKEDSNNVSHNASFWAAQDGKTLDVYVADQMKDWEDNGAEIRDFEYAALAAAKTAGISPVSGTANDATGEVEFENLPAGYYIIEDKGAATPISALMLDTVTDADVEIVLKATDETTKEVMTVDGEGTQDNELGLGRAVSFKVTQKIPDYTGYDYYYYMINDTMSDGLTFDPDSVVVKVTKPAEEAKYAPVGAYQSNSDAAAAGYSYNNAADSDDDHYWVKPATEAETTTLIKGTDYYLYYDKGVSEGESGYDANEVTKAILDGKTFIIAFADIVSSNKVDIGYGVEVTYTATINSNALAGINPNTNSANVVYSNDPSHDGRGDYDVDHPGIPLNDANHPSGSGPNKVTNTHTTKVGIVKKDGATENAQPLPGVEFTLTGTAQDDVIVTEEVYEINPDGTFWLLTDGTYTGTPPQTQATVEETTGGAGWVEIAVGETVANGVPVRVVNHTKYRPYVESTDSEKPRYKIVEANTDDYTSTTTKYSKNTISTSTNETYSVVRTGVTGDNGLLDFSQLGEGTYKLSETGILAGYNGIQDIDFTLTFTPPADTTESTGIWSIATTTPNVTFTEVVDEDNKGTGVFQITIVNNKGTELPSTGGIGTTIFYIVGTILVIGAGVVLISRKRMAAR